VSDLTWQDATIWPFEGRGFDDTARLYDRLPARAETAVREPVWRLSRMSTGISLRFVTDAEAIHVRYRLLFEETAMSAMAATGHSGIDLYAEGPQGSDRWVGVARPEAQHVEAALAEGLAPGERQYTLYLPLFNSPETLEIGVPGGARLDPVPTRPEPPVVFYGTSILHGAAASRCGMAIPNILGRRLQRPILNLSFAGNGRMEMAIGDLLTELEAAVFVVDCLPNMTADAIEENAVPLVRRLRQSHRRTPILLVEDRTYANTRFFPAKAQRHRDSRAALRRAWRQLSETGVTNLHYLQGDGLLPDDGEATVDSSHPTDLGMVAYADAYEPVLRALLGQY
jgi:lysophospholipase L1-like esterase